MRRDGCSAPVKSVLPPALKHQQQPKHRYRLWSARCNVSLSLLDGFVIYARVSTTNRGYDPTTQTGELREYVERRLPAILTSRRQTCDNSGSQTDQHCPPCRSGLPLVEE